MSHPLEEKVTMPDGRVVTVHGLLAVQWRNGDGAMRQEIINYIERSSKHWRERQGRG